MGPADGSGAATGGESERQARRNAQRAQAQAHESESRACASSEVCDASIEGAAREGQRGREAIHGEDSTQAEVT